MKICTDYYTIRAPNFFTKLASKPTYGTPNILQDVILRMRLHYWISRKLYNGVRIYLPHNKSMLFQMIINHSYVEKLSFIDEGLLSYTGKNKKTLGRINFIKRWMLYPGFSTTKELVQYPTDLYLFVRNISVKESSMIKYLRWPVITDSSKQFSSSNTLLVLSRMDNSNLYKDKEMLSFLRRLLLQFANKRIEVKAHPRETKLDLFIRIANEYRIEYTLLPDYVCLEIYVQNGRIKEVIGVESSILFYAKQFGKYTVSYAATFSKISSRASNTVQPVLTLFKSVGIKIL